MKKNIISIYVFVALQMGFSGCASIVANTTGKDPVGVSLSDRTVSQRFRDTGIENNALVNLYKLDRRYDVNARVSVHAFHDVVLLVGQVPDEKMIPMASQSVLEIREVKTVHNELEFGAEASYAEVVDDGIIKARLRKNLLLESGLKDSRIKVVVERGVVYLMGILSETETQQALNVTQNTEGVIKIISLIDDIKTLEKEYDKTKQSQQAKPPRAKKMILSESTVQTFQLEATPKTSALVEQPSDTDAEARTKILLEEQPKANQP